MWIKSVDRMNFSRVRPGGPGYARTTSDTRTLSEPLSSWPEFAGLRPTSASDNRTPGPPVRVGVRQVRRWSRSPRSPVPRGKQPAGRRFGLSSVHPRGCRRTYGGALSVLARVARGAATVACPSVCRPSLCRPSAAVPLRRRFGTRGPPWRPGRGRPRHAVPRASSVPWRRAGICGQAGDRAAGRARSSPMTGLRPQRPVRSGPALPNVPVEPSF